MERIGDLRVRSGADEVRTGDSVRVRGGMVFLAGACMVLSLAGCQAVNRLQPIMAEYHARGDYTGAAGFLDQESTRETYGEKSVLLWELERGSVALALKDTSGAIEHLDKAEVRSAYKYDSSSGDALTKWVVNDAETAYVAQPYEDMYANVLKQLAYLEAGKLQGFATAESLRVLNKAEHLRDVYRAYMQVQRGPAGANPQKPTAEAANTESANASEFIESPLGAYLAAVSFLATGDRNNQDLSARRLDDALQRQKEYVGPVNAADFAGLGVLAREDANVLVVGLSGRGPVKEETRLSFPVVDAILNIPYPRLRVMTTQVEGVAVEVDGTPTRDLSLVEDLSSVVAENYRRAEPALRSRTIARVTGKLVAGAAATVAVHEGARKNRNRDALTLATGVLSALLVQESEKADLRAWTFLPGQARVGLLKLPPGNHRLRVVYRLSGGGRLEQPWQEVSVSERGLTTVVSHYPG